jgi:hypothetical protein
MRFPVAVMFPVFLCLLFLPHLAAQEPITDSDALRSLLTDIAAQNEDEQDLEQLLETLEDLAENPVHVNDAGFEDVARITWLTEFQIKSLLDHVKSRGPILSYYEIASLYGFTPELAQTLAPFISLEKKQDAGAVVNPRRAIRYGKNRLVTGVQMALEEQEGYLRPDSVGNRYAGGPVKTYLRYSFSYANRVYFGITAEKDAGESFFRRNNPYGFDFYSAHFQLNTKGWLKTVTAGDFRADFGQGLVLWSGLGYGKSVMVLNAMRYNSGLRKYGSSGENRFMRGAGATFRLHPLDVSLFYSRKAIDATVTATDENGLATEASSFPTDGYHRTPNEIAKKHAAMEQIAGANISVNRTEWHIGATAACYGYDVTLVPNPYIYNCFAFTGKSHSNYSLDFRFRLGDANFYGEQALGQNGAWAMLYGVQMLIGEHMGANVLYRHYARDYHALYGMALGENPQNSNEEGFYMGLNWSPGGRWRFSSYWDMFRFPWLRYRADAPTFGQDAMLQADFMPSHNTKMYIQTRYKEKEENAAETVVSAVTPVKTASVKLVFSHQVTDGCGIGNHLEVKNYRKEGATSNGYFLAQDIYATVNTFKRYPLRITLRYAFFDTGDYNSRIYSFENDMLYAFSIPAFYDQGTRLYVLLKYALGKHFDLRFKYAATHYTTKNEIGSGLNLIRGDRYSEVKAQIVCKF